MDRQHEMLQAIRKSHCLRAGEEHACVGSIKIDKDGYSLDCSRCGKDREDIAPPGRVDAVKRVKECFSVAGIEFDSLAPEIQARVTNKMLQMYCPGCGAMMPCGNGFSHDSYYSCGCGYSFSTYSGWGKPDSLEK